MTHLNITFPEDLKVQLDRAVKQEKTQRSTLIQKAVRFYLDFKEVNARQKLLKEGCLAMNDECRRLMKEFKSIDAEASRYDD